jgi:aryl-alcohol dehydrogenase-like predicted oxidoreductase
MTTAGDLIDFRRVNIMKYRKLGRTGLRISEIGFGCGATAGLLTRDLQEKHLAVVQLALKLGINYFDTASAYGNGSSETNLGEVLEKTGADVTLATKVRIKPEDLTNLRDATITSVNQSLKRLGRSSVDLIQLHGRVAPTRENQSFALTPHEVLGSGGVLEGFKVLREQGKVKYFGAPALGDPQSLHALIESGEFDTIMAYYNLLNPSAGHSVPENFSALDYGRLIQKAAESDMGIIIIRVLAKGALTDSPPKATGSENTLSPGSDYEVDLQRAQELKWLVSGEIKTFPQAAIRFALTKPEVSTVLVGFSELNHVEQAVSCSGAGGLPDEAMGRLSSYWDNDFAKTV